jgi:hypothetical protein
MLTVAAVILALCFLAMMIESMRSPPHYVPEDCYYEIDHMFDEGKEP